MKDKIKILQLKILLIIMEIFLVLLIWTLIQLMIKPKEATEEVSSISKKEIEELFVEEDDERGVIVMNETPTPTPFVLSNLDRIRVLITNKEDGGIYHKNIDALQLGTEYRGLIEKIETEEGTVIINELPIEEYLYSVVPSEMPADYPMEALKAQAICARTYAYLHVLSPGYPEWNAHVDDTTSYQVYHNVEEQEKTTRAVNETEGLVLMEPSGKTLAQTYYYSTSCGHGSDAHVWHTKYADNYPYIKSRHINASCNGECQMDEKSYKEYINTVNKEDYEAEEVWYRWSYEVDKIDTKHMYDVLKERYNANSKMILTKKGKNYESRSINKFTKIKEIQIIKRGAGGVADELLITTDKQTYKVISELNIRYVLNDGYSKVIRQDGTEVEMNRLLPSAFIWLEPMEENGEVYGYSIQGGGYGHGAGMSQNAAKSMAINGMTAEEILMFFFSECMVKGNN